MMIDRLKPYWSLILALAFAMFMVLIGWEVQMAWPEQRGHWMTLEQTDCLDGLDFGFAGSSRVSPDGFILLDRGALNYSWQHETTPAPHQSEIDRLHERINALEVMLHQEQARRRALEKAYEDFYRAFGHALELAH